jgi:hypothetical protein
MIKELLSDARRELRNTQVLGKEPTIELSH